MSSRQALLTDIFENMSAMRRLMFRHASALKARPQAPTHAQIGMLFALSHRADLSVKDMARYSGMTSSAATQLLAGLVRKGWITRQAVAGDKRKVALKLSKTGEKILKNMVAEKTKMFAKQLSVLSDAELKQLKAIQAKIIANQR